MVAPVGGQVLEQVSPRPARIPLADRAGRHGAGDDIRGPRPSGARRPRSSGRSRTRSTYRRHPGTARRRGVPQRRGWLRGVRPAWPGCRRTPWRAWPRRQRPPRRAPRHPSRPDRSSLARSAGGSVIAVEGAAANGALAGWGLDRTWLESGGGCSRISVLTSSPGADPAGLRRTTATTSTSPACSSTTATSTTPRRGLESTRTTLTFRSCGEPALDVRWTGGRNNRSADALAPPRAGHLLMHRARLRGWSRRMSARRRHSSPIPVAGRAVARKPKQCLWTMPSLRGASLRGACAGRP